MKAEYMVASANTTRDLARIVETLLEQGWQLAGGVSVFGYPGGREYIQALYYREMPKKEEIRG